MAGLDSQYEIIVVDDGSSDGTNTILKKMSGLKFIENPYNLGYGASLKKGIRVARGEWIIITDADGTYPLDKITELISYVPRYDMVVGARETKNDFALRKPAKWLLVQLAGWLAGRKIPDLNSGLRIFRKSIALEFFYLFPSGFSFTTTITLACLTHDYTIKYVDIPYYKRIGSSGIRPRHFFDFMGLIFKILLYFRPVRMLSPLALAALSIGLARLIRDIVVVGYIGSLSLIFIFASFLIFILAFMAEAIIKTRKI